MTKVDYLAKLDKYLRKLPKEDYQEAMDYFSEYFEEAGPENEAQVIAELGTPKEAARDIISRLLDEKIIDQEKTPKSRVSMVWLAILAVIITPVALPLALVLFLAVITILALGVAAIAVVLSLGVAFLTSGIYMLFDSWSYLNISFSATALSFGLGLLALGLSLLTLLAAGAVCKVVGRSIVNLARKTENKRRKL
ncbi:MULTISPECIES: DUF1700 domain-containing protein [Streptococcus]|jgi:uncharacterized membrane protein|uniref:Uncharacterized membrane protein n=1 Tax=Streptococcus gallolyticus TaxID=315405 RepID=A0A1I7IL88_9STRE|nr:MULTISPECIES: DUF1700 domain-containing protein [Streptococcus]MCO7178459.1 DUF1700 domain-containing protein [Streptococcus gallolyticus]MCR5052020.1 DUF1700 domain-containing protein [Streptococcus sp.]MCY7152384.1 DUF1700 domain-containing protein [Streptococcus gallolyticus subsp. gallolyticus]MCY7164657.1 DUF1700 domain-containing protein [Streptococcus gallolyticus subsp. gallolyticus]MCY7183476.1 DUF1700 domain-containing protein [Streptococcus gallolyticus subsp. gallolyticus]